MLLKASTLCSIVLALSQLAVTNGQIYDEEASLCAREAKASDLDANYFLEARDAMPDFGEDELIARELGLDERSKIGGVVKAAENILGLRDAIKAPSGSPMLRFGGDAVAAGPGYAQMFQQNHKRSLNERGPRVVPGFGRLLSQAMRQQQQQQMQQRRDVLERDADADAGWDTAAQLYRRHLSERRIKPPSGSSMLDFGGTVIGAVPQYAQMAQNH